MIESERLLAWAQESGFHCEQVGAVADEVMWHLVVGYPQRESGLNVFCLQPGDRLLVHRILEISPSHRDALGDLSSQEREDLRFRLVRDLLRSPIEYQFVEESDGEIVNVAIAMDVFQDGLTKTEFFRVMRTVTNAMLSAVAVVRQAMGESLS